MKSVNNLQPLLQLKANTSLKNAFPGMLWKLGENRKPLLKQPVPRKYYLVIERHPIAIFVENSIIFRKPLVREYETYTALSKKARDIPPVNINSGRSHKSPNIFRLCADDTWYSKRRIKSSGSDSKHRTKSNRLCFDSELAKVVCSARQVTVEVTS